MEKGFNQSNIIKITEQGKISVSVEHSDAQYKYAFYLYFKNDLERVMYSTKSNITFNMAAKDGLYRAVFFRKNSTTDEKKIDNEYFCLKSGVITRVNYSVLSDEDKYKITLYDIKSNITFIVFQETNTNKNTAPFGLNFLISRGFNVISCNQNNDQYQGLSFEAFKSIVTPEIVGKSVFLYGSSLGGYCAVYYAGAVNGCVIAGAPRNSAHPSMIQLNDYGYYKVEDFIHKDISENELTNKKIYIFLDPQQYRDVYFINNFIAPAYSQQLEIINFEHAGHEVLHHINKTKQLSPLIQSIVDDDMDVIRNINFDLESEFSLYGKAEYHYEKLKEYLKKYEGYAKRHPTAENKMIKLNSKLNTLSINILKGDS